MDGKENPRGRFKKRNNEKIKPTQSRGRLFTVSVCISSTTVESKSEFFKDAQEVQVLSEDKIIPVTVANVGSASHKSVATSSNPALLQRVTDDDYEEVPAAVKSSALSNRYDSFLTKNKTNVIADGNSATIIGSLGSDGEGFHHRINIGVSYMPLQSNFNMLSLLRSISIEAYDKSFHFESDPQADAGNNSSNRNSNGASYSSNNRRSSFRHLDSNLMTASSSQRSLIGLQDNNEIANHNFNITWRTGKRAVGHEAASQRECLYDIYIGSCQDIFQRLYEDYDHIYGSSAFKRSKSRILNDLAPLSGADDLYSTVKYPILKHLGICDFPLCSMVQTVSTRLLLQILLLILTDNSVILLSSSCTLLTQIQYAIPRLIWPFKINESHRMKQILNSAVLAAFVNRDSFQKARSSHVQQPIVKPPTAEIRKKSFFADRGKKLLHTLSGKNFFQSSQNMDDGVASIAQTEYSKGPAETPQRRTSKEISIEASPELLGKTNNTAPTTASFDFNDTGTFISNQQHLGSNDSGENSPFASTDYAESPPQHSGQRQKKPVDPKKNKSYIIAIDSKTFYSAKAETRQYLFDLKGKGDKGYTIFDLDSCIVLVSNR